MVNLTGDGFVEATCVLRVNNRRKRLIVGISRHFIRLWRKNTVKSFHLSTQIFDYARVVDGVVDHARGDEEDELAAVVGQGFAAEQAAENRYPVEQRQTLVRVPLGFLDQPA